MSASTTISNIHRQLFVVRDNFPDEWEHDEERAFLIHSSVLAKVRQFLTRYYGVDCVTHTWPYQLQIGEQSVDTNLVFIKNKLAVLEDKLNYGNDDKPYPHLVNTSHYFKNLSGLIHWLLPLFRFLFVWDETVVQQGWSLYTTVEEFKTLQEFIETKNLQDFIVKITVRDGINNHNKPIKIVTFNGDGALVDLPVRFKTFTMTEIREPAIEIFHYYITCAFPWLQPSEVHHSHELIEHTRICRGLLIFLQWLRENAYTTAPLFNIMDLCTMHHTFCNVTAQSAASLNLSIEIKQLVYKFYENLKDQNWYIQDDQFDLYDYAVDRKCGQLLPAIIDYMQYNFQCLFKSIKWPYHLMDNNKYIKKSYHEMHISSIKSRKPRKTLKLVDDDDVVSTLRYDRFYNTTIDGINFSNMNMELFFDLLQFDTVCEIILDTNYKWVSSQVIKPYANNTEAVIRLQGKNKYSFTEHFITALKTMEFKYIKHLRLYIDGTSLPKNYSVFDDINMKNINFVDIKIESSILQELLKCRYSEEPRFAFYNCKIENTIEVWMLLYQFERNLLWVTLIEDESTWQFIFDFIANRITNFELSEFRFNFSLQVLSSDDCCKIVDVNKLKFTIDERNTKLLLWNSNNIVDLYDLKNLDIA